METFLSDISSIIKELLCPKKYSIDEICNSKTHAEQKIETLYTMYCVYWSFLEK